MDSRVQEFIQSLEHSTTAAEALFGSLSDTQLNWKPAPGKWSVGECLDHIIVSNKQYFPVLGRVTSGAHTNSFWQSVSPLSGFFGNMLIKGVAPGNSKKMKTARVFYPSGSSIPKSIVNDLAENNRKLISYLDKLGSTDLEKTKISSPVSGFITYSLLDALKILTLHEQRHINQAKDVTKTEGFPGT